MRSDATQLVTGTDVRGKKILVVGAGGIGCELVKNLVLTGFDAITMIDLDTIDYSNLNRQFLFRARHVGRSKAEVAREAVLGFPHDALDITAQHGNIKSKDFDLEFFKRFDIVLNALDNVDARRHVNRVCLAAEIPLVESGTQGYLGQVRAIIKGKTQCYECNPPTPQKTYPVCTIRNHPDKPIHCIVWAKELLLKKLFGGEETDLVDSAEGAADGDDDGGDGAEEPAAGRPRLRRPLRRRRRPSRAARRRRRRPSRRASSRPSSSRTWNASCAWMRCGRSGRRRRRSASPPSPSPTRRPSWRTTSGRGPSRRMRPSSCTA